jgi:hypothetical protein
VISFNTSVTLRRAESLKSMRPRQRLHTATDG